MPDTAGDHGELRVPVSVEENQVSNAAGLDPPVVLLHARERCRRGRGGPDGDRRIQAGSHQAAERGAIGTTDPAGALMVNLTTSSKGPR